MKEEELISATLGNKEDNDEEVLAMVAHYVLICYAEKEVIKKKKEYKQKSGQYQLKARIKRFGKQGEMEVTTKSTYSTNTKYSSRSMQISVRGGQEESTIIPHIPKRKNDGDIKARVYANGNPRREHLAKEEATAPTWRLSQCSSHQLLMQRKAKK